MSNISASYNIDPLYHYSSNRKVFYGEHYLFLIKGNRRISIKAKFDTGARTTSIDRSLIEELNIDPSILTISKALEDLKIEKEISNEVKTKIERNLFEEYSKVCEDLSSIQIIKSASGFTVRPFVSIIIEFEDRFIKTEANIKDRTGMKSKVLIGLNDMI